MVFTIFLPSTPFVKWKKVSHMFRGGKYQNSYFKAKKKLRVCVGCGCYSTPEG